MYLEAVSVLLKVDNCMLDIREEKKEAIQKYNKE